MMRRRLATAIAVGLLLAALLVVLGSHALPYRVYVIHTGSMSPTIPSTSAVLVHVGEYRVGQVVSFETANGVVTHRLIAVESGGAIVTQGDANPTPDPYRLTTRSIVGGVVAAPRTVGYWLVFMKNPLGLTTVLLGALVFWQLWSLASASDDEPADEYDQRRLPPGARHSSGSRRTHAARHVSA